MSIENQIPSLLRANGPMFRLHIEQVVGGSWEDVGKALKALHKSRKIKTVGKGTIKKWAVSQGHEQ